MVTLSTGTLLHAPCLSCAAAGTTTCLQVGRGSHGGLVVASGGVAPVRLCPSPTGGSSTSSFKQADEALQLPVVVVFCAPAALLLLKSLVPQQGVGLPAV